MPKFDFLAIPPFSALEFLRLDDASFLTKTNYGRLARKAKARNNLRKLHLLKNENPQVLSVFFISHRPVLCQEQYSDEMHLLLPGYRGTATEAAGH